MSREMHRFRPLRSAQAPRSGSGSGSGGSPPEPALARAVRQSARTHGVPRGGGQSWNPFESERVRPGARAWIDPGGPGAAADELCRCLETALQCPIGLIVGPHGTGKSTLLRHIIALAEDRGRAVAMVHRDGALPSLAAIRRLELVTTDAAGRLRPIWWLRLVARCRQAGTPLLLTAHREWFGRTVHRRRVEPAEAAAVVADCLRETEAESPSEEELARRLRESRGSLRAVLWSLYDDWEHGAAPAPGWPEPEA